MAEVMMRGSPSLPFPPQSAYPGLGGVSQGATSRIHLKPLAGEPHERCTSLGAVARRDHRIDRGGSLGPKPHSMFEKQDWSMPLEFSTTASKLKEFPSLSKEPIDVRSVRNDQPFPERTVVPKPPSSSPSRGSLRPSARPSSRLGSAASRRTQNHPGATEMNPSHSDGFPGTVRSEAPQEVSKGKVTDSAVSRAPQEAVKEPVIGNQTSAVIRQILPVVQRALASSNPAVLEAIGKSVMRLAKVFGQESIVAHQEALLDGVEKRLKETPASVQSAPRVLQMLGDAGGRQTIEEIQRRFPEFAGELSAPRKA